MEEEVDVEVAPFATQVEAILIAGRGVTDHLQVAVVIGRTLTAVDLAVSVEILELDVARAVGELAALESFLRGDARLIRAVGIEVLLREVAIRFEAPDVTVALAAVVGVEQLRVVVPLYDGGRVVAQVGVGINRDLIEAATPVDIQLPAAGTKHTGVDVGRIGAEHLRHGASGGEHVTCGALVPVEGDVQAVVQEAEVGAHVERLDALPTQLRGDELGHAVSHDEVAALS